MPFRDHQQDPHKRVWSAPISLVGLAAALVTALLAACADPEGFPPCSECNVVIVSIDTLRADHLGLYGYELPTSPVLDDLSSEAVVFERFVNNGGRTLPVHMTMLTSLTPGVHRVLPGNDLSLASARVTLAEALGERGWSTAGFTDSVWLQGRFGFSQGFDVFDDIGGGLETSLPKVLDWLEGSASRPFFLFLHAYDVHSNAEGYPYHCPGGFEDLFGGRDPDGFDGCLDNGPCATEALYWLTEEVQRDPSFDVSRYLTQRDLQGLRAGYDGCIRWVDQEVGRLFDRLRAIGLWDDTLVVVTSDHGEEFLDHGLLLHLNHSYEEMIRVPLLIKLPAGAFGGRRVEGLGSMVDLMPTVLDILGIAAPSQTMGVSLLPLMADGRPVRQSVHLHSGGGIDLTTDRWKLLARVDASPELYDLHADPQEEHNLAPAEPSLTARLLGTARRLGKRDERSYKEFRANLENDAPEKRLSAEEIEKLRALGYLD